MQIDALNFPADLGSRVQPIKEEFGAAKTKKQETKTLENSDKKVEKNEDLVKLKNTLGQYNISLRFSQDIDTKKLVVNLIDEKTGESVLQFPSELSLKLAADSIKTQGQFIDTVK